MQQLIARNVVSFLGIISEVWVSIQSSHAPQCRPSLDPERMEAIRVELHSPAGVSSTTVMFKRDNNNIAVNIPQEPQFEWFAGCGADNWYGECPLNCETNTAQAASFQTMMNKYDMLTMEDVPGGCLQKFVYASDYECAGSQVCVCERIESWSQAPSSGLLWLRREERVTSAQTAQLRK